MELKRKCRFTNLKEKEELDSECIILMKVLKNLPTAALSLRFQETILST